MLKIVNAGSDNTQFSAGTLTTSKFPITRVTGLFKPS